MLQTGAAWLLGVLQQHGPKAAVVYTPASGDDVNLSAIVESDRTEPDATDGDGTYQLRVLVVSIGADPAGPYGGVAAPQKRERVTIAGTVYIIGDITTGGGLHKLRLVARQRVESARPEYRNR